jgi:hypothetical protein
MKSTLARGNCGGIFAGIAFKQVALQEKSMNPVVHFEIGGTNIAAAAAFYGSLFGWKIAKGPINMIEGAGLTGHHNALGHEPSN